MKQLYIHTRLGKPLIGVLAANRFWVQSIPHRGAIRLNGQAVPFYVEARRKDKEWVFDFDARTAYQLERALRPEVETALAAALPTWLAANRGEIRKRAQDWLNTGIKTAAQDSEDLAKTLRKLVSNGEALGQTQVLERLREITSIIHDAV